MDTLIKLSVLGARGSVPVEGKNFALYGGAIRGERARRDDFNFTCCGRYSRLPR